MIDFLSVRDVFLKLDKTVQISWRSTPTSSKEIATLPFEVLLCCHQAKLKSGDPELMTEGCLGLWELTINRTNHADISDDCITMLIRALGSGPIKVRLGNLTE